MWGDAALKTLRPEQKAKCNPVDILDAAMYIMTVALTFNHPLANFSN